MFVWPFFFSILLAHPPNTTDPPMKGQHRRWNGEKPSLGVELIMKSKKTRHIRKSKIYSFLFCFLSVVIIGILVIVLDCRLILLLPLLYYYLFCAGLSAQHFSLIQVRHYWALLCILQVITCLINNNLTSI